MKVLAIDTATESATCAVIEDNKLLGEITYNNKKQHSVIIMPMVDEILKNLKLDINDIDGFAVSKGPGSFTGLRIGAANIKGICQGINKPFVGVSSLDALAYNMAFTEGIICPILDALRGNVYTALYHFDRDELIKDTDYMIISVEELLKLLVEKNKSVHFIGDGIYKYKDLIYSGIPESLLAPAHLNVVKASALAELGMKLLRAGVSDNIYSFAPEYFRKSQAERELDKKGIRNE